MTEDRVAVVLGASAGVGAEIAKKLARTGRRVIGFHRGRHNAEARAVCADIIAAGGDIDMRTMDVGSDDDACNGGIDEVRQLTEPGQIDVFVHSLSGASVGCPLRIDTDAIESTFWHLAHSFLYWTRWLAGSNRAAAAGCSFLALTNPCPSFYLRNSGVIGAAKAALEAYVRILAVELGPKGHRVNALNFGAVMTPALAKVVSPELPAHYYQDAEEVATMAAMLTTDPRCNIFNGAIVDGTAGATLTFMDERFYGKR